MVAELPKLIDYKKLSRTGQIDYEIWQHELNKQLWLAENTDPFATDPRVYNDYITESVYLLFAQSTQPLPVNLSQRRVAHGGDPAHRGGGEGESDQPAAGFHRNRDQAEPRGHRVLRVGYLLAHR